MTKIKLNIKNRYTGKVLFEYETENNTMSKTVEAAVEDNANLRSADLRHADLSYADLRSANLRYADLSYADLSYANLRSDNLRYADLSSADLLYADLRSADLRYANLSSANLRYAKDIPAHYTKICSQNILFVLQYFRDEVPILRQKLTDGEVDGSTYVGDNECGCLIGTLSGLDQNNVNKIGERIPFYTAGRHNLGESWFLGISKGDTPENNYFARQAVELCDSILEDRMPRIMPQIGEEESKDTTSETINIEGKDYSIQDIKDKLG